MSNQSLSVKGISRIDSESTHGWYVRGYSNGAIHSKFFSDGKWGSREASFDQAVQYRDGLFEQIEAARKVPRRRSPQIRSERNGTGVVGVSVSRKKTPGGKVASCYSVSWRPHPKLQKCTSFSIEKYGEEEAFRLAVQHRFIKLKECYGESVIPMLWEEYKSNPKLAAILKETFFRLDPAFGGEDKRPD